MENAEYIGNFSCLWGDQVVVIKIYRKHVMFVKMDRIYYIREGECFPTYIWSMIPPGESISREDCIAKMIRDGHMVEII